MNEQQIIKRLKDARGHLMDYLKPRFTPGKSEG
jgi:hypothetical protein